ncbi:hypothetical protein, partial [Bartonella bovis]|uniref:hypothetical protein n=1 Tax=Bartonella bovis TaxID=155194 RepID=UPI001304C441
DGANNYGVRVGESVTMATLTNVTITGGGNGKGVWMESSGTLKMERGEIKNVEKAVLMKQGTVTLTGVQISDVAMG